MTSSRVLIVDDNRVVADTMATLVRLLGHHCTCAYDGSSAIVLAADYRPDLILLDLKMPDINGFTVARALRQAGCVAKIVAITAFGESVFAEKPQDAGFDGVLQKPATAEQIAALMPVQARSSWLQNRTATGQSDPD